MTEEAAFLTAILATPGDDTARLVYADWLDEHTTARRRARAELIRTQVNARKLLAITEHWANTPSDQPGGSREDGGAAGAALAESQILDRRAGALLKKWGAGWLPRHGRREAGIVRTQVEGAVVSTGGYGLELGYRFERGFIGEAVIAVEAPFHGFEQIGGYVHELVRAHPVGLTRFGFRNHSPTVLVHTEPDKLKPEWWRLRVVAGDEEQGEEGVEVLHVAFESRADLVRQAPQAIVTQLGAIDFERFVEHDDGYLDHEHYDIPY